MKKCTCHRTVAKALLELEQHMLSTLSQKVVITLLTIIKPLVQLKIILILSADPDKRIALSAL
jgi:hypothetical protein